MAAANGKATFKGRTRDKSRKGEGDNESNRDLPRPIPVPKTKSNEPPCQLSAPKSNELSRPLFEPNSSSDAIEPSINDLSETLQMADLGGSEVEDLLKQAYDLNRRLKAELTNRATLGESTPDFPVEFGLDGQHTFVDPRQRTPILPPLVLGNRTSGSADHRYKQSQNHMPASTAHKIKKT